MTKRAAVTRPSRPAGPIFVGGLERSGTSLIYALLASHPGISMTRRTNWWRFFDGHFGDLARDEDLDRCLDAMLRYRRHLKLEPDAARLRAEFRAGPRTSGRLFELLERHRAERLGRARWGDKSLHTERYAARVLEEFPDARIIHMMRDPRDRFASVVRRWHSNRGGVGAATATWMASADLAERNRRRWGDRYLILRYEDLASAPEATLHGVCAFIGEPFRPEMLEMGGDEGFRAAGGNSSFGALQPGVISTSSIGRFRQVLAPDQIAYVQERAGSTMSRLGYEPDPTGTARQRAMRYRVVFRTRQSALASLWRIRERALDLVGRSPSSHTIVARMRDADA